MCVLSIELLYGCVDLIQLVKYSLGGESKINEQSSPHSLKSPVVEQG
jgi:hypothetical protein